MEDVKIVADDLYFIQQPIRTGWFCGITVVLGADKIGLVDTGFENTPVDYIFPLIKKLGRKPESIDYVVNTHRDGDHVLGNKAIKEKTKAQIAIHKLEAEAVVTADVKLIDGNVVELGDRKFKVIHSPGHRPGSICLYDQANRTLITGDSVCGERTDLIRMDKAIYIRSLKKLLDLDIGILVMSHPFKPLGKSIVVGNDIKEMIVASIGIAENLK
ncbi:MAG: MBL fold metallo-hydrolase [Candidatus Bathyarchaeota archaeon]|nr:MAG: MBL fold metallo-hydrolase [Candidatus Bathyarchaeota archaeon]